MESTDLIFIFGNNPGTNHPRMLTSLQMAKDHGAKIIVVNPLPDVGMMRVINPNPQDYKNPLELPFALLGKGRALADLYLPVCVNGDAAAIKGILKDVFEREQAGHSTSFECPWRNPAGKRQSDAQRDFVRRAATGGGSGFGARSGGSGDVGHREHVPQNDPLDERVPVP